MSSTHRTVLTVDDAGAGEDFEYPCTVAENGDKRGLSGTGAGAAQLEWRTIRA